MKTLLVLTNRPDFPALLSVVKAYQSRGYVAEYVTPDLERNKNGYDIVNDCIVDLDSYDGKDCETFKEHLAEIATNIYLVCTTSFQRLTYYKDFHCFTSFENLIDREFFHPF